MDSHLHSSFSEDDQDLTSRSDPNWTISNSIQSRSPLHNFLSSIKERHKIEEETKPATLVLRSQCLRDCCPFGKGIYFTSRISPSPSKSGLRSRRRRRSDQAKGDTNLQPELDSVSSITLLETLPERLDFKETSTPKKKGPVKPRKVRRKLEELSDQHLKPSNNSKDIDLDKEFFEPGENFFVNQHLREETTSDYYSGLDTPSKFQESTRRLSARKSYNSYIAYSSDEELDEWWKDPKTDYTYSASLSYRDQVTPDRRIGSPNMSRKGLRNSSSMAFTDLFTPYKSTETLSLRSRRIPKKALDAFSDGSDEDEIPVVRSSKSRFTRNQNISSQNVTSSRSFTSQSSSTLRLHMGLENGDPDSSSIVTATPIIRKGTNSLVSADHDRTTTASSTMNGLQGYSFTQNTVETTHWKDSVMKKLSSVSVRHICSVIFTSIILWSVRISDKTVNSIKNYFYTNQRSRDVGSLSVHNNLSESQTVTSTTVTSVSRTVFTVTRNSYEWYRRKVDKRPFVWGWIPIILLLLLLLPLCAYWLWPNMGMREETKVSTVNSSSVWQTTVLTRVSDFLSDCGSLVATAVFWCWSIVVRSFQYISWTIQWCCGWLLQSSRASYVYTSGLMGETSFARIYSSLSDSLDSCTTACYDLITYGFSFISTIFISLWNLFWWILYSLAFWTAESKNYTVTLFDKLVLSQPEKQQDTKVDVTPSTPLISPPSNEKLVSDLFENPKLHLLISQALKDTERSEVQSMVKAVVTAEVEQLRQSVEIADHRFAASNEKIEEMQSQQRHFVQYLKEMEVTLNAMKDAYAKDNPGSLKVQLESLISQVTENIDRMGEQIAKLQLDHATLEQEVRSCCKSSVRSEDFESHVKIVVGDLLGFDSLHDKSTLDASRLKLHLQKYFVAKDELESRLAVLNQNIDQGSIDDTVEQTAKTVMMRVMEDLRKDEAGLLKEHSSEMEQRVMASIDLKWKETMDDVVSKKIASQLTKELNLTLLDQVSLVVDAKMTDESHPINVVVDRTIRNYFESNKHWLKDRVTGGTISTNASDVYRIVQAALNKYDADRTGLVDHALETGGGSIVSTRCTEAYQGHQAELTILGYPIYRYSTNTPRAIIQPDRMPGQCYAFKGSQGFVVIQLAGPVSVSAFSMEHIPKSLSPTNSIESAPKEFSVHGLNHPDEKDSFYFGNFIYEDNDTSLQYFPTTNITDQFFKYVELKILSNHGSILYTCLYRFRVHGVRLI